MNGYLWKILFVNSTDPMLIDRTGSLRVATTDPTTFTVYLSDSIDGPFLTRVLIHELGHCAIFSFGLLRDIHRMVRPAYWVEAEEWMCNFIADYGITILKTACDISGISAVDYIVAAMEDLIA